MANTRATRVFQQGILVALFALAYCGAGLLVHVFYFEPANVATFCPASGLFLAVLLLSRFRMWPVLGLAAIVSQVSWHVLVYSRAMGTTLGFASTNVLEARIGVFLLRRFPAMSDPCGGDGRWAAAYWEPPGIKSSHAGGGEAAIGGGDAPGLAEAALVYGPDIWRFHRTAG
jgi:hypothetical protein